VVLYKVEQGKRKALDIAAGKAATVWRLKCSRAGGSTLRVEFLGSRFRVVFNGKTLFEVEDGTFPRRHGRAMDQGRTSVTLFDNFSYGPR